MIEIKGAFLDKTAHNCKAAWRVPECPNAPTQWAVCYVEIDQQTDSRPRQVNTMLTGIAPSARPVCPGGCIGSSSRLKRRPSCALAARARPRETWTPGSGPQPKLPSVRGMHRDRNPPQRQRRQAGAACARQDRRSARGPSRRVGGLPGGEAGHGRDRGAMRCKWLPKRVRLVVSVRKDRDGRYGAVVHRHDRPYPRAGSWDEDSKKA